MKNNEVTEVIVLLQQECRTSGSQAYLWFLTTNLIKTKMPSKKVDLHLAKSLAELNSKILKISNNNPKLLSKATSKLFKEAQLKENLGDEEAAYILYTRCINSVLYLNSCKHDLGLDNSSVNCAIDNAEKLTESLKQRYQNKQNKENGDPHNLCIENHIVNSEKNDVLFVSGSKIIPTSKLEKENVPVKETTSNKSITCTQLYNMLYEEKENVVIFDVRLTRDYNKSHIKHSLSTNIPEEILKPGITASAIEKLLSPEAQEKFSKRGNFEYVVLLNWESSKDTISKKSPLFTLREALTKWTSTNVLKSDPLILENGYEDWLLYYPTQTTNPNVSKEEQLLNTSSATLISLDVDYPDLNDEVVNLSQTPDLEVINLDEKAKSFSQEVPSSFPTVDRTLKPTMVVKPKPAWQIEPKVTNQRDIDKSFNRLETMTDEQLHNTVKRLEKEKEFAKLCRKKENEADEELKKLFQQEANQVLDKIQQLEIEMKKLEEGRKLLQEENTSLQHKLSKHVDTSQSEKAIMIKLDEKKLRDIEVEKLRNERKKREMDEKADLEKQAEIKLRNERKKSELEEKALLEEQKQTELKFKTLNLEDIKNKRTDESSKSEFTLPLKEEPNSSKRGLSRSHSSPNIAQLIEGSGKIDKNRSRIPNINREAKPASLTMPSVNRVLKPHETSVARQRNFNPVYSSQGNAQTGLRNLGNTCFMNSVIQCLSNTTSLVHYLVSQDYADDIKASGSRGEVIEELSILVDQLRSGNCRSITPSDFKNTVSRYLKICIGNEQQDAHEFLTKLMEKLHSEINTGDSSNKAPPPETDKMTVTIGAKRFWSWHMQRNKSAISDIFEGLLLSQLTCLYCLSVSNSYEVFSCLSVPIPSSSRCNLNECMRSFLKTERISGDAGWNCPTCKQKREAEKQMFIVQLPQVLVVHLKRFSYEGMWRSKLKTMVDFPLYKLDMSPYFASGCANYNSKFSLFGVVNHFGTLEGGHYIAACKSNGEKWFKYDDQEVTEISSNSVVTDAAYMMFYNLV